VSDDIVELEIPTRQRSIGRSTVGRVLPAPARRAVGPFVFFDQMGPSVVGPGTAIDVPPHPHIGLATVTYLFEGEVFHRDSVGSAQAITPGAINWMTAGHGIVHSERTPAIATERSIHGLQLWVALPAALEECAPSFAHHPADTLPQQDAPGVQIRVLAGTAFGARSPVAIASALFYAEARLAPAATIEVPTYDERALFVVRGEVRCGARVVPAGTMAVLRPHTTAVVEATCDAHVMMLGGDPLDGPRHIWWNFVSSSAERIEEAALRWKERRFPLVPGDEHERVELTDVPRLRRQHDG
jgi:hypothetical protein